MPWWYSTLLTLLSLLWYAPWKIAYWRRRLWRHFGRDPVRLPIQRETFSAVEHPNVQRALDVLLAAEGATHELVGMVPNVLGKRPELAELASEPVFGASFRDSARRGPVLFRDLELPDGTRYRFVEYGFWLLEHAELGRIAVLVTGAGAARNDPHVVVEVMAAERATADRFLALLRAELRTHSVYRGGLLSLSVDRHGGEELHVHPTPTVTREQLILPEGVLERIERLTVAFSRHAELLREAGRHLRRGILLHGAPGTGKTLTAMYLAATMKERTTILVTGASLSGLTRCYALARALQPSMLVLEDVDLVAEERSRGNRLPVLFELLNEMDGLAEDADVLFVLTTNRPEVLEPALASRPGRIDLSLEIPLPDEAGRKKLFHLYSEGLVIEDSVLDGFVGRTKGASGAFIKELMRRALLFSAEAGRGKSVAENDMDAALREMVLEGGELGRRLLGMAEESKAGDGASGAAGESGSPRE